MDKLSNKELCILILQYNSADLTMQLLESICAHEGDNLNNYNIIVMDNASDTSKKNEITSKFGFVRFVKYEINYGFAKAHNKILGEIEEEWVLLLNNDCILLNDAIHKTLKTSKNLGVDYSTCHLYNKDGTDQINFTTSPAPMKNLLLNQTGFNRFILEKMRLRKDICSVGFVNGAFLMLRRKSIPMPKLFDDRYFMYTEDLDLMIRMEKDNRKGIRVREGKVTHLGGMSAEREWGDRHRREVKWEQAKECMYRHYPKWQVSLWIYIKEQVVRKKSASE